MSSCTAYTVIFDSEPLPGSSPANRKHKAQHDIRFILKSSDYRPESPLNISVTAKCTIKLMSKRVNVGSQSPTKGNLRNYIAPPQIQSASPCERI